MEMNRKTYWQIVGGVILCIVVYWLLHETQRVADAFTSVYSVLSPFISGAAFAFVLNVPLSAIERKLDWIPNNGLRRAVAIILTIVLFMAIVALVVLLLVPQIQKTVDSIKASLPGFITRTENLVNSLVERHPALYESLRRVTNKDSVNLDTFFENLLAQAENGFSTFLTGAFDAFGAVTSAIGSITGAVFDMIIGLFFSFYCLAAKDKLSRQGKSLLYAFLPEKTAQEFIRILSLTRETFSGFISGQCLEAIILGSMFAIAMWITGMPYVPLVSVLVAVTALVPMVGAFVGCIFGALFILVDNPVQAVWFVVLFLVLQQMEDNIVYPKVMGKSIGLPGIWVLMAVSIGGDLMGVAGMLVMIPVASVLYALLRELTYKRLAGKNLDMNRIWEPQESRKDKKIRNSIKNSLKNKKK